MTIAGKAKATRIERVLSHSPAAAPNRREARCLQLPCLKRKTAGEQDLSSKICGNVLYGVLHSEF